MLKAVKMRLYPNAEQAQYFAVTFGCVRWVYNEALAYCNAHYEANKDLPPDQREKRPTSFDLQNRLTLLKKEEGREWLKDADSQALKYACASLDQAFKNFFRRVKNGETPGFPRFKSKFRGDATFTSTQISVIKLNDEFVKIPKAGDVRQRGGKLPEGAKVKRVTVRRTPTGKFYATVLIEDGQELPAQPTANLTPLGVDVGCKTDGFTQQFAALSDGGFINTDATYKRLQKRLAREQRRLARKEKGSNNRIKQKKRLARVHEQIGFIRQNTLHQITHALTRDNEAIAVETLNIKGMMAAPKPKEDPERPGVFLPNGAKSKAGLSRSLASVSLGEFFRQLEYKSQWRGVALLKCDQWAPTSKTCSACGYLNQDLTLSVRAWTCPSCGADHHRDTNAAKNIAKMAMLQP